MTFSSPLLLENRASHKVDYIMVATAAAEVQERRVLSRPGMTRDKFEAILRKQVPDEEKRRAADFLVFTDIGEGFYAARAQIAQAIEKLVEQNPDRFQQWRERVAEQRNGLPFDVVAFDLDDTLVPTDLPVMAAYEEKYAYMEKHMPRSLEEAKSSMRTMMIR